MMFVATTAFFLSACDSWMNSSEQLQVPKELVLHEGARLEASFANSSVAIIAGNKLQRRYEWGSCGLDADMFPRKERWLGNLGMYDAAGRIFNNPLAGCDGISRTVVQEGQIHFSDEMSAEAWISRYKTIGGFNTVWSKDGLLVQWGLIPQRNQINVDLWQICIKGKRPINLAGASDESIKVMHPSGSGYARLECVDVSEDVITDTQKAWSDNWRQADEWIAKAKH